MTFTLLIQRNIHSADQSITQTREGLNQYNLKNENDKRVDVSEERMSTPPQRPIVPKSNHANVTPKLDNKYDHETDIEDEDI